MNTVCANCQALNRIPDDRIEDGAKCGRCGHELFDGDVINATGATLDKLLKDDLPVVVDFCSLEIESFTDCPTVCFSFV